MDDKDQRAKAEAFRKLHHGPHILRLPNAWDAASAVLFEQAGFSAIATTSSGVAWSLGYPDGQRISSREMLEAVGRIARSVSVPVSADLEAGYGSTVPAIAATMREAIAAGVVGVNFEDGTGLPERPLEDISRQVEKLQAIRQVAAESNVPLVLNARVDTYLRAVGDEAARFDETLRRADAYRRAGADCIFVIGLRRGDVIARLVRAIDAPVNILTGPGAPTIPELEQLGVARVTFGGGIMGATLALVKRISQELLQTGTYSGLENAVPHGDMDRLFARGNPR